MPRPPAFAFAPPAVAGPWAWARGLLLLWTLGGVAMGSPAELVYRDPAKPVEERVSDLLGRLTLEEKIALLSGRPEDPGLTDADRYQVMGLPGNVRLGIPAFRLSDAEMGVRCFGPSTAYPNGMALAATWDLTLARAVGVALGRDCRSRGVHVLLGPAINLYRAPMSGRNFEMFGEDPLLSGRIAAGYIQGVQSQQVAVTAKHLVANDQNFDVNDLDSTVDERTLRELYLKPFEIAVKAGAWGVMDSYNSVNGVHSSQNGWLNQKVLKEEWGFRGFVMSDWISCYDTLAMANGGLDIEMPTGKYFNSAKLKPMLQSGAVSLATLDDKLRRQFRVAFTLGWMDRPQERPDFPKDDPQSDAVAALGARESITLLKNAGGLLPLDPMKVRRLVLVGHNADLAVTGGEGSSHVIPFKKVSLHQALAKLLGPSVQITVVPWNHPAPPGSPVDRPDALNANGAEGTPPIPAEYGAAVKSADAVIVMAGFTPVDVGEADHHRPDSEGEAADRSYGLPPGQERLIEAAAALNRHTIIILNAGGSVATEHWIAVAPALLDAFYPGQDGAPVLADILFGRVNPSGKLPFSWEKKWEDSAAYSNYPLYNPPTRQNTYREGIFLGYRWFDRKNIEPLFPFGFGLSYTTFAYSNLEVSSPAPGRWTAAVTVENTGSQMGDEVAELYVAPPAAGVPRPVRELKGFARVRLGAHQKRRLMISVEAEDLKYWDPTTKHWTLSSGAYEFSVGGDSRHLGSPALVEI